MEYSPEYVEAPWPFLSTLTRGTMRMEVWAFSWLASIILCPFIASQKGRSGLIWFFSGLFFGVLALMPL